MSQTDNNEFAPTYECFKCGIAYRKSDSLAANTRPDYAETYCSRVCEDKMEESLKEQGISELKRIQSEIQAIKETTEVREVGGFKLKVRKESE